jgi:capsular exopolysaccharide synthesis family protein
VPPTWQFDLDAEAVPSAPPVEVDEPPPVSPVAEAGTEETEFQDNVANTSLAAKLVVRADAEESLVEQFRRLAAALHHAQLQTGARTVMIASAVEKEGKTLTATNLSLTLSQSYQRRVLLVDADLRRPSIHRSFQLDNSRGLGDVLKQKEMDGTLPVHRISPTLWVMTAGRPDSDPMSGLVSETMKQFLLDAADQFDWVVLDTPPVALLTDAKLLAAMIDTALLVVNAKTTPYPLAMRAVEAIGASRVLGVVLNRAERSEVFAGYPYYSYSYRPRTPEKTDRRRFRLAFTRKT